MLTRCPACETRFRVPPEHLYAASGQVRCGRCEQIFDAQREAVTLGPPVLPIYTSNITAKVQPRRQWNVPWKFGVLLLLIALPAQWIWWERAWLATTPNIGPIITQLCKHLDCGFQPFRAPEQIGVLQRTLKSDPKHPNIMHFRLRMVNRAPQAQPFPLLDLRLFDAQSQIIGQRRFTPQHYLPSGTQASLMLPGAEMQAALELLLNPQQVVPGFQIDFR